MAISFILEWHWITVLIPAGGAGAALLDDPRLQETKEPSHIRVPQIALGPA